MSKMLQVVVVVVLMAIAFGIEAGCGNMVPASEAIRAAETLGFTEVRVVKKDVLFVQILGGDKADNVRFTVQAVNPAGRRVQLYVFAGWPFKAATIRTK